MAKKKQRTTIQCERVELGGIRYVILQETLFDQLCQKAGVAGTRSATSGELAISDLGMDNTSMAAKLIRRRQVAGLTQAGLARRAGIRPETLNRIERGRTTPDFATIRKLVIAISDAERERNKL